MPDKVSGGGRTIRPRILFLTNLTFKLGANCPWTNSPVSGSYFHIWVRGRGGEIVSISSTQLSCSWVGGDIVDKRGWREDGALINCLIEDNLGRFRPVIAGGSCSSPYR